MPTDERNRKLLIPPALFVFQRLEPMARIYSAEEWQSRFPRAEEKPVNTVVTIGNFDGVHLGHQAILRETQRLGAAPGSMSVAVTFYPHPAKVLRPTAAPPLLMTLGQRLDTIEALGIDATLVLKFDERLARLEARDFVQKYLKDALHAANVVYGQNFRFGYQNAGDASTLYGMGIDLYPCPPLTVDGTLVSSSAIRNLLQLGNVEEARRMLGRPFALAGEVKPGTGQGRVLVVPTLNLDTEQELLPKMGVYATEAMVGGKTYWAATNIGVRPTFDGVHPTVESHLFDFRENLKSGKLEVRFWKRLRDERKFSGADELREQVLRDIETAKQFFATLR